MSGRLADHGLRDGILGDADDGRVAARATASGVRQSPVGRDFGRRQRRHWNIQQNSDM